ncbi:hypothetical protein PA7_17430 [Pseudonocardia asaccharolytica DSM 44247 = NBRC 16224]|uniref:Uncharacterized protein n=1 Tax=Pseudonocardia asaccharolytica DSM 44247 = NBRC 16224 TaxID=1123024 RepID=A0A511CZE3_9PSEU|nr:hypothetical protein [Pseudonocardia asaccharolytica]GEL17906.1 hypothetical protein PA7_17430 [Pseudonocardia asaccharolytica DSM 44247 = NBRC 16224]
MARGSGAAPGAGLLGRLAGEDARGWCGAVPACAGPEALLRLLHAAALARRVLAVVADEHPRLPGHWCGLAAALPPVDALS